MSNFLIRFQHNRSEYHDKLLLHDKIIYASTFDESFNNIEEYLNNELKPIVDSLVDAAVLGVAGQRNKFLHNVGDGSVDWRYINATTIDNYTIPWKKIASTTTGSTMVTDGFGSFESASPIHKDRVLVSRDFDFPEWQLVTSEYIEEQSLIGDNFGVLSMENFIENQFFTALRPDIITSINIINKAINNSKLLDGDLTYDKLGKFSHLPYLETGFTPRHVVDGAITVNKLKENSIIMGYNSNQHMRLWDGLGSVTVDGGWVYKQILRSVNLLDNSIDQKLMPPMFFWGTDHLPKDRAIVAKAFFKEIPAAFQFNSEHLALGKLDLKSFDAEVTAAINRLSLN